MRRAAAWSLLCASVVALAVPGREARGEELTCIGSCRIDYGACIMNAKGDSPDDQARRADCGRAYVQCASKCRGGGK